MGLQGGIWSFMKGGGGRIYMGSYTGWYVNVNVNM